MENENILYYPFTQKSSEKNDPSTEDLSIAIQSLIRKLKKQSPLPFLLPIK